jgi:hypothetical protein
MAYIPQAHVAYGDIWTAGSHNILLDNSALPFAAAAAGRLLYFISATEIGATPPPGFQLMPQDAIPPLSGIAAAALELVESSGAGTAKPVLYQLRFDDAASEGRMWVFRMFWAATAPVLKIAYRMANANTSDDVVLIAQLAAVSDTDAAMQSKVFAAVNSVTITVPDTANVQDEASITLTNADSIAKGDWACLLLFRDGGAGGDTAAGDLILTSAELQYG